MGTSILVTAKYILYNTVASTPHLLVDGAISITDNKINRIEKQSSFSESSFDEVYHFSHHLIMPGLVNTHSHAGMTLYRGYADDMNLNDWLNKWIWPAEAQATAADVEMGAKLAAIEALMSGTTTFNSMYWYVDQEIAAFQQIGPRLICGPNILTGIQDLNISYAQRLISDYHGKFEDTVRIGMYPHAPYTVSDEDYHRINDFVATHNLQHSEQPNVVVHTHLAESKMEMQMLRDFAARDGFTVSTDITSPTRYLDSIGILNDKLYVAHAVELSTDDVLTLKRHDVGVSINSNSNMKLANSFAPVSQYYETGVKIGLGTDSATSNNRLDMFQEMKTTALIQKGYSGNPVSPKAYEIIRMATYLGSRAMNWNEIGDIREGGYADLITIDLNKPHLTPIINPTTLISHIVYAMTGSDVSDVMIGGKWKMRDRHLPNFDLPAFLDEFSTTAQNLINRIPTK